MQTHMLFVAGEHIKTLALLNYAFMNKKFRDKFDFRNKYRFYNRTMLQVDESSLKWESYFEDENEDEERFDQPND